MRGSVVAGLAGGREPAQQGGIRSSVPTAGWWRFKLRYVLPWFQGSREPRVVALERKSLLGDLLVCSCSSSVVFPPQQISPGMADSSPPCRDHCLSPSRVNGRPTQNLFHQQHRGGGCDVKCVKYLLVSFLLCPGMSTLGPCPPRFSLTPGPQEHVHSRPSGALTTGPGSASQPGGFSSRGRCCQLLGLRGSQATKGSSPYF